jgi:hypothetical protein
LDFAKLIVAPQGEGAPLEKWAALLCKAAVYEWKEVCIRTSDCEAIEVIANPTDESCVAKPFGNPVNFPLSANAQSISGIVLS